MMDEPVKHSYAVAGTMRRKKVDCEGPMTWLRASAVVLLASAVMAGSARAGEQAGGRGKPSFLRADEEVEEDIDGRALVVKAMIGSVKRRSAVYFLDEGGKLLVRRELTSPSDRPTSTAITHSKKHVVVRKCPGCGYGIGDGSMVIYDFGGNLEGDIQVSMPLRKLVLIDDFHGRIAMIQTDRASVEVYGVKGKLLRRAVFSQMKGAILEDEETMGYHWLVSEDGSLCVIARRPSDTRNRDPYSELTLMDSLGRVLFQKRTKGWRIFPKEIQVSEHQVLLFELANDGTVRRNRAVDFKGNTLWEKKAE